MPKAMSRTRPSRIVETFGFNLWKISLLFDVRHASISNQTFVKIKLNQTNIRKQSNFSKKPLSYAKTVYFPLFFCNQTDQISSFTNIRLRDECKLSLEDSEIKNDSEKSNKKREIIFGLQWKAKVFMIDPTTLARVETSNWRLCLSPEKKLFPAKKFHSCAIFFFTLKQQHCRLFPFISTSRQNRQ